MRLGFILGMSLFWGPSVNAQEARTAQYTAMVQKQDSANYKGGTAEADGDIPLGTGVRIDFGALGLKRTYLDGSTIQDTSFGLGAEFKYSPKFYLQTFATTSTTAHIYALWSAAIEPHYILGSGDMGLGIKYSEYSLVRAATIHPSYVYAFSDEFQLGAGAYAVETNSTLIAYQLKAIYHFTETQSFRLEGASGRTLEDAGLPANFDAVYLEYAYRLTKRFEAGLSVGHYRSDIREEWSYGLRLGFH